MKDQKSKKIYLIFKGLLSAVMLLSAGMYFLNHSQVIESFTNLGYPTYLIYPLALAKILGVSAIWLRDLEIFKQWAYAGFFYDLILAFTAHIYMDDGEWPPAFAGIVFLIVSVMFEYEFKNQNG